VARRFADSYEISSKGAAPSDRWHVAQREYRIGAICLSNVTGD
jgi:hypothetical protein